MAAMVRPRQTIECGDFVLRRWRGQDDLAPAFTLIRESADHLLPWMPWVARHSEQTTRDFLANCEAKWASGEAYNYAISEDGTPIGMCQAYRVAEPEGWRLGYWLHPAATGRGIATRATAALVTEMFSLPDVPYVEISHDQANAPSGAVPRRLGFTELRRERAVEGPGAAAEDDGSPPAAPSATGIEVVWRLNRPAPPIARPGSTAR